jgi:hypothetical protein
MHLDPSRDSALLTQTFVAQSHDWLEQIWGWSQFGGFVLALFAILFAKWSADEARKSSASAAESAAHTREAVKIARDELDMLRAEASRRPDLRLVPTIHDYAANPRSKIIQLGFMNEGDLDALGTVINLIYPVDGKVWKVDNWKGVNERELVEHWTSEPIDSSGRGASYVEHELSIRRRIATVTYFRIVFRTSVVHNVRVSASHPEADVSEAFEINLS